MGDFDAKTQWIITHDYISDPKLGERSAVDISSMNYDKSTAHLKRWHEFRMKDGDGQVYYKGKCNDDSSFAPVDDFGVGSGAVNIEYYNEEKKTWQPL